jgi:hypothetical protein
VLRIVGIDPEVVMIAVRTAESRHRLAAVRRSIQARVQHVDRVAARMIGRDVRVVERALSDVPVAVDERPRLPGIV